LLIFLEPQLASKIGSLGIFETWWVRMSMYPSW
jgi:hypothetical protein